MILRSPESVARENTKNGTSVFTAAPPTGEQQQQQQQSGGLVPDWLSDLMPRAPAVPAPIIVPQVPQVTASGPGGVNVMVPQQYVARLIGRGGEVIMGICNATGADVRIRQETKDMGYSLAVITGPPASVERAEAMVRQKLGMGASEQAPSVAPEHAAALLASSAAAAHHGASSRAVMATGLFGPAPV